MRSKRLTDNQLATLVMMVNAPPSRRFVIGTKRGQVNPSTAWSLHEAGLISMAYTYGEICWATPLARQLIGYEA